MKSRRSLLGSATALLLSVRAKAQTPGRAPFKELARHALTGSQEGMEAILVEVTAQAGVPSAVHRHPGIVLGYVLEGEMVFAINGDAPQTVKAGGTFYEPMGALHTTGGSAKQDAPLRFLAFIVAPKGSPVTLPA